MLKNLLSTFTVYKNAAAVLALSATLAGAGVQTFRLDRATTAATVLTAKNESLAVQLETQNIGIKALAAKAAQLDAAAERARVAAKRLALVTAAKVKALESAPTPASCEEAIDVLTRDAAGLDR